MDAQFRISSVWYSEQGIQIQGLISYSIKIVKLHDLGSRLSSAFLFEGVNLVGSFVCIPEALCGAPDFLTLSPKSFQFNGYPRYFSRCPLFALHLHLKSKYPEFWIRTFTGRNGCTIRGVKSVFTVLKSG
jgi:hypothetical protein